MNKPSKISKNIYNNTGVNMLTYSQKAKKANNPVAQKLLKLIEKKQTNLALSLDVNDPEHFLQIAEQIGPEICVLKTHIDVIDNFTPELITKLQKIADQHNFLIFEDRKFADIGNTVKMQYAKGVYKIVDWADLTNAHVVPGPGIIEGLKEVAEEKGLERGLILLAQMSSSGNLATSNYTKAAVQMAKDYSDFVIGFIGNGGDVNELTKLVELAPEFIIFTPGVKLGGGGDQLKQQYTTPDDVIKVGSDIIIVGRGIYGADNPLSSAQEYRQVAWQSYQSRIK